MRIKTIIASIEKLPLTKPYTIAYHTITDTEIVLLEIVLENGITGVGASNPFAEVVGETPSLAHKNLQTDFVHAFAGRNIHDFETLINEALVHFPHAPGTLAAIDIALHDAFCRHLGISVLDYYGQKTTALPTSVTIGIKDIGEMLEEARANYVAGFKVLKIKTGLEVEADIERITKLHEAFGQKLNIRVDANQGYNLSQLQYFFRKTEKLNIELIEQPLPVGHEHELLLLPENQRKILVADETLVDEKNALALATIPNPYGVFNIKLMKCGGIKGAGKIARIAEQAGIDLFWGCNDESIISITAALQVAYSCGNTKYLDLDGSFDLSRDFVKGGFLLKDGYMHCLNLPGLGLTRETYIK
jgi:L-alanine-DL-glutamate epimerase-like enolase superfamily enzyme